MAWRGVCRVVVGSETTVCGVMDFFVVGECTAHILSSHLCSQRCIHRHDRFFFFHEPLVEKLGGCHTYVCLSVVVVGGGVLLRRIVATTSSPTAISC